MRIALFIGLLFGALALHAADGAPLKKAGDFHLKRARYGAAVVTEGNFIYIAGGADRGEYFGDLERFDTTSHQVVRMTDQLIARRYLSAALVDHKIYLLGGWGNAPGLTEPVTRMEVFDLATGKITLGPPPPTPRAHAAAIVRQGKIYLIGGQSVGRGDHLVQTNAVEIFDPATNRWTPGPAMPSARDTAAVLVQDFIMVPGGFAANAAQAKVEYFLPQQNAWQSLPDLSRRTSAHSVAFLGEHLFLFGNYGAPGEVLAYHLKTRTSRLIKPGYTPAYHTAATVNGDRLYVIGGTTDREGEASDLIQVFALSAAK